MRRYDILFGIVLIFSIIDFALAAPVPVQEKPRLYVDVVDTSKDVRTVLRRGVGGDELEGLFKTFGNPIESSDTHASSGSAPPVPDHGPTNVAQAPPPNPASSTANPDSSMKPPSLSIPSADADAGDLDWAQRQSPAPPKEIGLAPATDSTNANFDWDHLRNVAGSWEDSPRQRPATESNFDWDHWRSVAGSWFDSPRQRPATESNFDWDHWRSVAGSWLDSPRQRPATDSNFDSRQSPSPPKEIGLAPATDSDLEGPYSDRNPLSSAV
jgi:hypothetical protein